jgi:hypothetical protein
MNKATYRCLFRVDEGFDPSPRQKLRVGAGA